MKIVQGYLGPGIYGQPGPGTDRSESVRDFQNFVGPGSVRSEILKFFWVLVRSGPRFSKFCWPCFGPWIPAWADKLAEWKFASLGNTLWSVHSSVSGKNPSHNWIVILLFWKFSLCHSKETLFDCQKINHILLLILMSHQFKSYSVRQSVDNPLWSNGFRLWNWYGRCSPRNNKKSRDDSCDYTFSMSPAPLLSQSRDTSILFMGGYKI